MDAKGGAAGTALADDVADEEAAFGRMAANWKEMGKWRGGKTLKQPVKTNLSGQTTMTTRTCSLDFGQLEQN